MFSSLLKSMTGSGSTRNLAANSPAESASTVSRSGSSGGEETKDSINGLQQGPEKKNTPVSMQKTRGLVFENLTVTGDTTPMTQRKHFSHDDDEEEEPPEQQQQQVEVVDDEDANAVEEEDIIPQRQFLMKKKKAAAKGDLLVLTEADGVTQLDADDVDDEVDDDSDDELDKVAASAAAAAAAIAASPEVAHKPMSERLSFILQNKIDMHERECNRRSLTSQSSDGSICSQASKFGQHHHEDAPGIIALKQVLEKRRQELLAEPTARVVTFIGREGAYGRQLTGVLVGPNRIRKFISYNRFEPEITEVPIEFEEHDLNPEIIDKFYCDKQRLKDIKVDMTEREFGRRSFIFDGHIGKGMLPHETNLDKETLPHETTSDNKLGDFVFYVARDDANVAPIVGLSTGLYKVQKFLGYNKFANEITEVPKNYEIRELDPEVVKRFYFGTKKRNSKVDMSSYYKSCGSSHYFIHGKVGKPFLIFIDDEQVVFINRMPPNTYIREHDWNHADMDLNMGFYSHQIKVYKKVQHIFIGKDPGHNHGLNTDGVTILLQLSIMELKYVFIGDFIYEFQSNEEILSFSSLILHDESNESLQSHPVAESENFIYLFNEKKIISKSALLRVEDKQWLDSQGWAAAHVGYMQLPFEIRMGLIEDDDDEIEDYDDLRGGVGDIEGIKMISERIEV